MVLSFVFFLVCPVIPVKVVSREGKLMCALQFLLEGGGYSVGRVGKKFPSPTCPVH